MKVINSHADRVKTRQITEDYNNCWRERERERECKKVDLAVEFLCPRRERTQVPDTETEGFLNPSRQGQRIIFGNAAT